MSLPPLVRWEYGYAPDEGTDEARLMSDFLRPRDWLGLRARQQRASCKLMNLFINKSAAQ